MKISRLTRLSILLMSSSVFALAGGAPAPFPPYLSDGFDYATFTRFDAATPPKTVIYQSNGFMALQERGFGGQKIIIPVAGSTIPSNSSDRLVALEIDPPVFVDASRRTYSMADSPAKRSMTYFADRTVYRVAFDGGPEVSLTVYPVYGKPDAVLRIKIVQSRDPMLVRLHTGEDGFQVLPNSNPGVVSYGAHPWPYRLLMAARPQSTIHEGSFEWSLRTGAEAALLISLDGTEKEAEAALADLSASPDLYDQATHRDWNQYLASAPLVAPAGPVTFTIGTTGKQESIAPEELVRSELWFWRGLLNTTCQARYVPASPLMIADWNVFMGMWSNDGIAEAQAIAATSRKDLARGSILNWFRYSVNAQGDGTSAWTIFPSGANTFAAKGPEADTQGVPVQGSLVGEYIRLTGDTTILNEKPGGVAGDRTVWQALLAYQRNLPQVRDPNHDHLIDWLHTYETGWDDKNSPFIDLKKEPTSTINEQVFNLWSLQEMIYLSKIQGEDPAPWEQEYAAALKAVRDEAMGPSDRALLGPRYQDGETLDSGRKPGCLLFPLLRDRSGSYCGHDAAAGRPCEIQRRSLAHVSVRHAQVGRLLARSRMAENIRICRNGFDPIRKCSGRI